MRLPQCLVVYGCCMWLSGCGDASDGGEEHRSNSSLHSVCDSALISARVDASTDIPLELSDVRLVKLPDDVGRIADVTSDSSFRTFLVLDFSNAIVWLIDGNGAILGGIGQRGEGPGDLSFDFATQTSPARLRFLSDVEFVVLDERSLKAYRTDGTVLWDRPLSRYVRANRDGMHLSPSGANRIRYSESGKYRVSDTARAIRTSIEFRDISTRSTAVRTLFRADNNWVLIRPFVGFPPQQPYMSEYGRGWDGDSARIVLYSYQHYGVCFFRNDGALVQAHRRDLAPYKIDRAEQDRALSASFGTVNHDTPLPFLKRSAREAFEGLWPEHGPLYTDIVLGDSGEVIVLRRTSAVRVLADVFKEDSGYVGTFAPPADELPRRVIGNRALSVDREQVQLVTFTWRNP